MRATPGPPRPHRLTLRVRLGLTYASVVAGIGGLMLALLYVLLAFVPQYQFETPSPTTDDLSRLPAGTRGHNLTPASTVSALEVSSQSDLQRLFLVTGLVVLAVAVALGGWVCWRLAGRILRPISQVDAAANLAANGRFDHRVEVAGPRDELTALADSFNGMLGELERSFHAYRRFAAHASHELRTPLATTRAMLDVALAGPEGGDRELLTRLRDTNERSIETVEALLDLAAIEAADLDAESTRLDDVVREVLDDVADAARRAGITLSADLAAVRIRTDARLVRHLVVNLVANAVRHNRAGGWVRIRLTPETGRLVVANSGDVLTADQVATLTDPFVRIGGSTGPPGRGLGLTLAAAIADRTGWSLALVPGDPDGLEVTIDPAPGPGEQSRSGSVE